MPTLKEIGAVLEKHISDNCDCEDGEGCREYRLDPEDQGWDNAVDLSGQIQISGNREKLARLIFNIADKSTSDMPGLRINVCYKLADALISKLPEWIEVKKP